MVEDDLAGNEYDISEPSGEKNTGKVIGIGVLSAFLIGFLVLLAVGLMNRGGVTGLSGFTRVNKPAPLFAIEMFDGSKFELSEHIGKPIVINFWASWCGPCRQEAPLLENTWQQYQSRGVLFVGVNMQDEEAIARAYLDEFNVTYTNVRDVDGRVTVDYGVIGIPVTFFIDREGVVVRRFVGALPDDRFLTWIDELFEGVAPSGDIDGQNLEGFRSLN